MSSHETEKDRPDLRQQEATPGKPDLSEIPPLRSVEEVEQAARPGLSQHEREAEDRYASRQAGGDDTVTALPIPAPGGSRISGGPSVGGTPSAVGGSHVAAGPLQINTDDDDSSESRSDPD